MHLSPWGESIHFHPGVKRSHVQKFFKNVMQSNLIFYFSEKTKKCEWYARRNIENTAIEYFVENQIKSDQENEGQKEIRRVAFKHELCFEKLFIVSSFFWHFVIQVSSPRGEIMHCKLPLNLRYFQLFHACQPFLCLV